MLNNRKKLIFSFLLIQALHVHIFTTACKDSFKDPICTENEREEYICRFETEFELEKNKLKEKQGEYQKTVLAYKEVKTMINKSKAKCLQKITELQEAVALNREILFYRTINNSIVESQKKERKIEVQRVSPEEELDQQIKKAHQIMDELENQYTNANTLEEEANQQIKKIQKRIDLMQEYFCKIQQYKAEKATLELKELQKKHLLLNQLKIPNKTGTTSLDHLSHTGQADCKTQKLEDQQQINKNTTSSKNQGFLNILIKEDLKKYLIITGVLGLSSLFIDKIPSVHSAFQQPFQLKSLLFNSLIITLADMAAVRLSGLQNKKIKESYQQTLLKQSARIGSVAAIALSLNYLQHSGSNPVSRLIFN